MSRQSKLILTIIPTAVLALSVGLTSPSGPAHALGNDGLRSVIGQALSAPLRLVAEPSTSNQPHMMVQSDMMGRMEDMPGRDGMMRGMMGMMQMMGRMGEMMDDEEMMGEMGQMMETCNRMMQAMVDDHPDETEQPGRDEPQETPEQ